MYFRSTTALCALCLSLATGTALAQSQKKVWTDAEVMKVHNSAILIDTHNDVTSKTVDGFNVANNVYKAPVKYEEYLDPSLVLEMGGT